MPSSLVSCTPDEDLRLVISSRVMSSAASARVLRESIRAMPESALPGGAAAESAVTEPDVVDSTPVSDTRKAVLGRLLVPGSGRALVPFLWKNMLLGRLLSPVKPLSTSSDEPGYASVFSTLF
jgi:hypothetical protein